MTKHILYHGTCESAADSILKNGLQPRRLTRRTSNYETHPSNDYCVYVTTLYAPYFASVAAKNNERWAIIEVEVDERWLLPDEDYLEQASRPLRGTDDIVKRTEQYRETLHLYKKYALDSLYTLGTAAVFGGIERDAIRRLAYFDPQENRVISMLAMDPSITLINHQIMLHKYKALTRWFFEPETVSPSDLWLCTPNAEEHTRRGFAAVQTL